MNFLEDLNIEDKLAIVELIKSKAREEISIIKKSADAARDGATHEDAIAKSKYDTHGLELSYLAASQLDRLRTIESQLLQFTRQAVKSYRYGDPIGLTHLVCLTKTTDQSSAKILYISKSCAGISVVWNEKTVQVVSPESPLGLEIIDCYLGDIISLGQKSQQQHEIVGVI